MIKKYNVIGIGEILWEVYPEGRKLGGSPANFVYHTGKLGANSTLISSAGFDLAGNELSMILDQNGIDHYFNPSRNPTGKISYKEIDNKITSEYNSDTAWDEIKLSPVSLTLLEKAQVFYFGTLAQRGRITKEAIQHGLKIVPGNCLKIFDANLKPGHYSNTTIFESLKAANVVRIRQSELPIFREIIGLAKDDNKACKQLVYIFNLKLVVLSKDSESLMVSVNENSRISITKNNLSDTTSSEDAFTAAIAMGLLKKMKLPELHQEAINYAAQITMHKDTIPLQGVDN